MADEKQDEKQDEGTNVDYSESQAAINKAKAKAADADRERLAKESE